MLNLTVITTRPNILIKYLNSQENTHLSDPEKMANEVLGSIALAYAVCEGIDIHEDSYLSLLRELSDGPFLWRSVRRDMLSQGDPLIDGRLLGYLLRSYWNDPMEMTTFGQPVKLREVR